MTRRVPVLIVLLCSLAAISTAAEGMWLFNQPPKAAA